MDEVGGNQSMAEKGVEYLAWRTRGLTLIIGTTQCSRFKTKYMMMRSDSVEASSDIEGGNQYP